MKRELGIARCGLACCLCSENDKCSGCNSGECPDKEWCENRKCSLSKNIEHCYNCDKDCRRGLLSKIKPYAFTQFVKRYGEDYLLDCLEQNEKHGILYHREGIVGDYDDFDDVEELIDFIKTGKKKIDISVFIERCINSITDNELKNAAFVFSFFLKDNGMQFEKAGDYWKNQQYFYVKYKNEFVCYILVNGAGDEEQFYPFTVWSDDSNSDWYRNSYLPEDLKSIAVSHIDICEKCGACKGGTNKQIFGSQYSNVCRTTFRFINPNIDELECLKELVLLRKRDIDRCENE